MCISHFLVVVAEEQDNSPPAPPGSQEETAAGHTNTLPLVEGDMADDRSQRLDTNLTEQQSAHPIIEEQTSIPDPIDVVMHDEPKESETDLLFRIHGLYRLLDLINEQGSGGAGMINVPRYNIIETQPIFILKWTRSSSLRSPWRSL